MELRHLRYFVAVAEQLNFRRAAEVLQTSQPSLSLQIRALEDELGVRLFDRDRRSVELTGAGRFYLHEVRQILGALRLANEQVARAGIDPRAGIVIGGARGSLIRYLPGLLTALRASQPAVSIKIRSSHPAELVRSLGDGSIAFGFVYGDVADPRLVTVPLWTFGYCVALPSLHPLATSSAVALAKLRGERLIQYARATSPFIHDQIETICRDHGFAASEVEEAPATSRVISAVACGDGIAVVPDHWRVIGTPGVSFVPLAARSAERLQLMACYRGENESPMLRDFIAIARASGRP